MVEKESKGNKPFKTIRSGVVSATIWSNKAKDKKGVELTFYSVNFERAFKDKEDEWQHTTSFNLNDLPRVQLVLSEVYKLLSLKPSDDMEGEITN